MINDYETEFVASTTIHNTVETTTTVLDAYPSINDCSGIGIGCVPPYQAPAARWSDTVVAPSPTVTSISPTTGPAGGGTSVTITGTNLSGATAVDFGIQRGDHHRRLGHLDHRHLAGRHRHGRRDGDHSRTGPPQLRRLTSSPTCPPRR